MTLQVLAVAEDRLGFTLARDLCDRVVVERGPGWLADLWNDPSMRESQRVWVGLIEGSAWVKWTTLKADAPRVHGLGIHGYALAAYRAVITAWRQRPRPDVLVLCIDTDGKEELRAQVLTGVGLAAAGGLPVLIAAAHQESEAWVVAGFVPSNEDEWERVKSLQRELGFDPVEEPHRLTPKRSTNPRDAKRVCGLLLADGEHSPRGVSCWLRTPLEDLQRRGMHTGLPEYLADVASTILAMLADTRR